MKAEVLYKEGREVLKVPENSNVVVINSLFFTRSGLDFVCVCCNQKWLYVKTTTTTAT